MRGVDALRLCPELIMVQVPVSHGKADTSIYREASSAILRVLSETDYGKVVVQRSSVDEAYLDLTRPATAMLLLMGKKEGLPDRISLWNLEKDYAHLMKSQAWIQVVQSCKLSTCVAGFGGGEEITHVESGGKSSKWWNRDDYEWTLQDILLVCASTIMNVLRKRVEDRWGYTVSAGISETKILAKLACGLHKPNNQTVVPSSCCNSLLENVSIDRITGLGGKLGSRVKSELGLSLCGEVQKLSYSQLWNKFGVHTGNAVYQLVRGEDINNHVVCDQIDAKTTGCGKSFPGKASLKTVDDLEHWVKKLVMDLQDRLESLRKTSQKVASKLTVSFRDDVSDRSVSSSFPLCSGLSMVESIKATMVRFLMEERSLESQNLGGMCDFAISSLYVNAGTFYGSTTPQITSFFHGEQQDDGVRHGSGEIDRRIAADNENCLEYSRNFGESRVYTHSEGHTVPSQGKEGSITTLLASEFQEKESEMSYTSSFSATSRVINPYSKLLEATSGVVNPYTKLQDANEKQDRLKNRSTLFSTATRQPKLQFTTISCESPSQAMFDKPANVFSNSEFSDKLNTPPNSQPSPKQKHEPRRPKKKPKILPLAGSKCEWAIEFDEVDPETLDELGDCWTSLIKLQIEEAKQQKILVAERELQVKRQKQLKSMQGIGRYFKKDVN